MHISKTPNNVNLRTDPSSAAMTMAKLQSPVKQSFEKANDNLKDIYSGLTKYSKAVEKKFKEQTLPLAENDAMASQSALIDRAIAMHLLREGHFDVASTFIKEVNTQHSQTPAYRSVTGPTTPLTPSWAADFGSNAEKSVSLQNQFTDMFSILAALQNDHNLAPAISWASDNSAALEARSSNLEFDLCRLQYVILFQTKGTVEALSYARKTLPRFGARYVNETNALLGALAFNRHINYSPYADIFAASQVKGQTNGTPTSSASAFDTAAQAFTSDFCALLSLSSASPLLTAVTAGYLALPTLIKYGEIQRRNRTSWTTAQELPVEIVLPEGYQFHSVFVCPVSKEQSTDSNPPVMLPCAHIIARESMERISKGLKFKCPYCPNDCHPRDAKVVYL
jgi:hypothetical protein